MHTYYHPHSVVLLSSSFQYSGRRLFFPRARLFFDRIELSGWQLGKKHTRQILLDDVDRIEWDAGDDAVFHLSGGGQVRLTLPHRERWMCSVEQRLHWSATDYAPAISLPTHFTARRDSSLQELITFATSMG